ncbi:MAG: MBL fold metallo-hydrolase [Deltaproteobacteria bacterium]|nr:MBL fold metallo-hydrolase [Deltaproteobacteria bacterium]
MAIKDVQIVPCRVTGPRGVVKSFLISGDDRLILVDTGFSDADADIIIDQIEKSGRKHEDLKLCVLTHRHGDHTGGLKKLKKTLKFKLMAHELDMPAIQKATGHEVDTVLKGGERIPDCGGIRVIHTPGHTHGSISLYIGKNRTLIAGDMVLSAGKHLVVSPAYLSDDPEQAEESVKKLIEMNLAIEKVLVGHGEDIFEGGAERLGKLLIARRTPDTA